MMGTATLQTPKTGGKSRFSKALPVPPSLPPLSLDDLPDFGKFESTSLYSSQLPSVPPPPPQKGGPEQKELPQAPIRQSVTGPPPPPPPKKQEWATVRETTMAAIASPPPVSSPINSPFSPRLPSKSPGIPPPVSVPRRRPVAAPTAAAAPTLSVPTPTSSLPMPTSPDRSPSPAASISSLLSAYSNHTAESTPRSSDSYSAQSPTVKDLQKQDSSSPPPLPLKDASRVQIQTQTQPAPSTHTASPLKDSAGSSSSPQDQLWRRRSLKADKHIAVPELNLVASNGSTVNPVAHHGAPTSQPPTQPLPPPPSPLHPAQGPQSRSANGGLPGRNIRPVLDSAEPAVPQIEVNNMGQEASSLKQRLKSKKDHESPKAVDQAAIMSPVKSLASVSPLSAQQRLPTPDYGTHDVLSPQLEVVVSPVSPALTPELPNDQSHPPPPPIPRKALGPALDHRIRHAKSSPSLAPKPSNSALNGVRSPGLPVSPAPGRDRGASHSQAPPLSAGAHGDPTSYPDFYPPPPPPPASYHQRESRSRPQTPTGRSKPISETGSEVTVRAAPPPRPEWLDYPLREPDPNGLDETDNPGAALFPRNWYAPLGPDEILDAKPLENKHFRCITNHRIMTAGKQKNNPIACRLCGHKDRNAECYICSSCHLNVCSGCTGHLRRFKGDLESVLQAIEEKKAPKQLQPLAALQQDGDESATAAFLDED